MSGQSEPSPAVMIVVEDQPLPQTVLAVSELQRVLGLALERGAEHVTVTTDPTAGPQRAVRIYVGRPAGVKEAFSSVDLQTPGEEEILIAVQGRNILLAGHDLQIGKIVKQAGTSLAVYTYMQRNLGVRWLWPGELGEHVPSLGSLPMGDEVYRYTPQVHGRNLRLAREERMLPASALSDEGVLAAAKANDAIVARWHHRNRGQGSFRMVAGHAFGDWAKRFHEEHPEYFALQPDGTRSIYPTIKNAKLCISNPAVTQQILSQYVPALQKNPASDMVSASPNDSAYSGFCTCANCTAWDAANAPPVTLKWKDKESQHPALTDRYAHFWNRLAEGFRKAEIDRPIYIGVWAYGAMRTPPVQTKMDSTIRVGFVGALSWGSQDARTKDLALWDQWASNVKDMVWRPNMFHYGWTLPGTMLHGLSDDFKHLAARGLMGIDIDTLYNDWATRGLDYYALAQLAWDPSLDPDALLEDYIHKAFGSAAASSMRQYYQLAAQSHRDLSEAKAGITRYQMFDVDLAHFTPQLMGQFESHLQSAQQAAANDAKTTDKQRQRIAFLLRGHAFAQAHLEVGNLLAQLRTGQGDRIQLIPQAAAAIKRRGKLGQANAKDFAIGWVGYEHQSKVRKMASNMGPLSTQDLAVLKDTSLILLPGRWDFSTDPKSQGEAQGWQKPGFDSSKWQKISTFDVWGSQLASDGPVDLDNPVDVSYNGDAWYRTQFTQPELTAGQQLWLELPAVDKSMVLYLNGKQLAQQVYDPQVDGDAWQKPRRFDLTPALQKGSNTLAIKVTSKVGAGGIYRGAFLRKQSPAVLDHDRPAGSRDAWKLRDEGQPTTSIVPGFFVGEEALRIETQDFSGLSMTSMQPIPAGDYTLTFRCRAMPGEGIDAGKALAIRVTFVYQDGSEPQRLWIKSTGTGQWESHQEDITLASQVKAVAVRVFISHKGTYDLDEVTLRPR